MADPTYKKISELTELAVHPATTDYFPFVDASAGETKRVTLENIDKLGMLELTDPGGDFITFWDDSAGAIDWLTAGDGLTITGGTLDADILGIEDLVDPGADRIMFWDDSASKVDWLTAGDGLTISGSTISAGIAEGQIADHAITDIKLANDYYHIKVLPALQLWSTGDGKFYITILEDRLDGANIFDVIISCDTPSTSGIPTVQIARGRRATPSGTPAYNDVLSTRATIDVNEYTSEDGANQPVINASYDDIAIGDILRFDIDVKGTGTKGLDVMLEFEL